MYRQAFTMALTKFRRERTVRIFTMFVQQVVLDWNKADLK